VLLGLMPAGGILMGTLATELQSARALAIGGLAFAITTVAGFALVPPLRRL